MLDLRPVRKKAAPKGTEEVVPGEIMGGRIRYLSLCPMGKNRIMATYKADGTGKEQEFQLAVAVKAQDNFEEEGLLTALVYAPNAIDDDGNWAGVDAIKAIAYDHMMNGEGIDIFHDNVPVGTDRAALVESFIVQKADPRFSGLPMDPTGGWGVVIQLKDEALRSTYRGEDGWRGISMGGTILVNPKSVEVPKAAAISKDDFFRTMRRLVRRALSTEPDASSIRSMDLSVLLPRPGEIDFMGNLSRPTFHINLSGDL